MRSGGEVYRQACTRGFYILTHTVDIHRNSLGEIVPFKFNGSGFGGEYTSAYLVVGGNLCVNAKASAGHADSEVAVGYPLAMEERPLLLAVGQSAGIACRAGKGNAVVAEAHCGIYLSVGDEDMVAQSCGRCHHTSVGSFLGCVAFFVGDKGEEVAGAVEPHTLCARACDVNLIGLCVPENVAGATSLYILQVGEIIFKMGEPTEATGDILIEHIVENHEIVVAEEHNAAALIFGPRVCALLRGRDTGELTAAEVVERLGEVVAADSLEASVFEDTEAGCEVGVVEASVADVFLVVVAE